MGGSKESIILRPMCDTVPATGTSQGRRKYRIYGKDSNGVGVAKLWAIRSIEVGDRPGRRGVDTKFGAGGTRFTLRYGIVAMVQRQIRRAQGKKKHDDGHATKKRKAPHKEGKTPVKSPDHRTSVTTEYSAKGSTEGENNTHCKAYKRPHCHSGRAYGSS